MSARARRPLAVALLAATALACSDSTEPAERTPVALAFASRQVTIGVGDTMRLVALVTDRRAGILADEPVTWRSLDPATVSVAGTTGLALALDTGTARVVATAGALADTATVRVTRRVASLALQAPDSIIAGGGTYVVPVVALDANGQVIADAPVRWESTDSTVLRFNDAGRVFSQQEGLATIRAISGTARGEATIRTRYFRQRYGFVPTAIAMGDAFICALDADGRAHCGGGNSAALGRGVTSGTLPMGPVSSDERFATLEADNNTACAITAAGRLFCWGSRAGAGSGTRSVPTAIIDSVPVRAVSIGTEGANCALGTDGIVRCWGRNDAHQTGHADLNVWPTTPKAMETGERFAAIAVGFHDACGVALDAVPVCWGELPGWYEGTSTQQFRFLRVASAPPLVAIAINGHANACGLTATGETWCWGARWSVTGVATRYPPTRVAGIPAMRELHGTYAGVCGVGTNGEVWCWGDQSGNSTPSRWRAPYRFRTIDYARSGGTCGVTTEDEVIC